MKISRRIEPWNLLLNGKSISRKLFQVREKLARVLTHCHTWLLNVKCRGDDSVVAFWLIRIVKRGKTAEWAKRHRHTSPVTSLLLLKLKPRNMQIRCSTYVVLAAKSNMVCVLHLNKFFASLSLSSSSIVQYWNFSRWENKRMKIFMHVVYSHFGELSICRAFILYSAKAL